MSNQSLVEAVSTSVDFQNAISLLDSEDPHVKDERGRGLAHLACLKAEKEGVEQFLLALFARGVDINAKDDDGCTVLHAAIGAKHYSLVPFLLKQGADSKVQLDSEDHWCGLENASLLHFLCSVEQDGFPIECRNCIELLLESGVALNGFDNRHRTPLLIALQSGNTEVARYLVKKGANVNVTNFRDQGVLHLYGSHKTVEVDENSRNLVKRFLEGGVGLNDPDRIGNPPLFLVLANGNCQLAQLYLSMGADPLVQNKFQQNALHALGEYEGNDIRSTSVIEQLLAAGVDLNAQDHMGLTPLHNALESENLVSAKKLLTAGSDVKLVSKWKQTTLHTLCDNATQFTPQTKEVIQELLDKGVPLDEPSQYGWTAFLLALRAGNHALAYYLTELGANLQVVTEPNENALQILCGFSKRVQLGETTKKLVELFIRSGINVNGPDEGGWTPLLNCLERRNYALASLLLDYGADPKVTYLEWNTLHFLGAYTEPNVSKECKEVVKKLLDAGINPQALDSEGKTPIDLAEANGNKKLAELLEETGKRE